MDAQLKELSKLENLTGASASKGKTAPIADTLDAFLQDLYAAKERCRAGEYSSDDIQGLAQYVGKRKREIDERQKEIYNSMSRIGKAIDKRFPSPLPSYPDLFESDDAKLALQRTIALHLQRTGQFQAAETFSMETSVTIPADLRSRFISLHKILESLRHNDIGPALSWCQRNRDFLEKRNSPLEFHLHRSEYLRLLLASTPSNPQSAILYARQYLGVFFQQHFAEIQRLMACLVYLPESKLKQSPYADLLSPSLHSDLEPLFAKEYSASLGMSRELPLRVVGDIGGGGALARIEKGRKIMRDRKSEWSQNDELPIEIPLPPQNRYHSIFTCPVSKEQSTEANPPMMMSCGHVLSKDSLQKLSKSAGRVKCPYCPSEAPFSAAIQLHF